MNTSTSTFSELFEHMKLVVALAGTHEDITTPKVPAYTPDQRLPRKKETKPTQRPPVSKSAPRTPTGGTWVSHSLPPGDRD